jgi:hypothetical protein
MREKDGCVESACLSILSGRKYLIIAPGRVLPSAGCCYIENVCLVMILVRL